MEILEYPSIQNSSGCFLNWLWIHLSEIWPVTKAVSDLTDIGRSSLSGFWIPMRTCQQKLQTQIYGCMESKKATLKSRSRSLGKAYSLVCAQDLGISTIRCRHQFPTYPDLDAKISKLSCRSVSNENWQAFLSWFIQGELWKSLAIWLWDIMQFSNPRRTLCHYCSEALIKQSQPADYSKAARHPGRTEGKDPVRRRQDIPSWLIDENGHWNVIFSIML